MAAPSIIGIDPNQTAQAPKPAADPYAFMSYMSGLAGPVVASSLYAAGNTSGASITSAAVNAAAGGNAMYGYGSSMGASPYLASNSGMYGTGGGMYLNANANTGTGTDIVSDLNNNGMQMIALQASVGQSVNLLGMQTNILKTKQDMEANVIRNTKFG